MDWFHETPEEPCLRLRVPRGRETLVKIFHFQTRNPKTLLVWDFGDRGQDVGVLGFAGLGVGALVFRV